MSNCTVVVPGDVVVEGLVAHGPLAADPDDPRFRAAVLLRYIHGITQGGEFARPDLWRRDVPHRPLARRHGLRHARGCVVAATLTNSGPVPLTSVRSAVTFEGDSNDPQVKGLLLDPAVVLEAGASVALSETFDLSSTNGDPMDATVGAGGLGPAGNPVAASASGQVVMHRGDQLMGATVMSDSRSRVHYFDDQFLRTQDFSDEQEYHVAAHRRHNIAHHVWGIVVGLELVVEEGAAFLEPGVGVDGFGRELVVANRRKLPAGAFDDKGSDELEVWLEYDRQSGEVAPEGYAGCDGAER